MLTQSIAKLEKNLAQQTAPLFFFDDFPFAESALSFIKICTNFDKFFRREAFSVIDVKS